MKADKRRVKNNTNITGLNAGMSDPKHMCYLESWLSSLLFTTDEHSELKLLFFLSSSCPQRNIFSLVFFPSRPKDSLQIYPFMCFMSSVFIKLLCVFEGINYKTRQQNRMSFLIFKALNSNSDFCVIWNTFHFFPYHGPARLQALLSEGKKLGEDR